MSKTLTINLILMAGLAMSCSSEPTHQPLDSKAKDEGITSVMSMAGHSKPIHTLVFSKNGKTLLSVAGRVDSEKYGSNISTVDEIKLWDVESGVNRQTIIPDKKYYSAAVSPDMKSIALCDSDDKGLVFSLNLSNGQYNRIISSKYPIASLTFSPDGNTLAGGVNTGEKDRNNFAVQLWDSKTGKLKLTLASEYLPTRVVFSADGKILAHSSANSIWLWDVATGKIKQQIGGGLIDKVADYLAISPNGGFVACGGDVRNRVWNTQTGTAISLWEGMSYLVNSTSGTFSPNGKLLVCPYSHKNPTPPRFLTR